MDEVTSGSMSLDDEQEEQNAEIPEASEQETTPGGDREVKWKCKPDTDGSYGDNAFAISEYKWLPATCRP